MHRNELSTYATSESRPTEQVQGWYSQPQLKSRMNRRCTIDALQYTVFHLSVERYWVSVRGWDLLLVWCHPYAPIDGSGLLDHCLHLGRWQCIVSCLSLRIFRIDRDGCNRRLIHRCLSSPQAIKCNNINIIDSNISSRNLLNVIDCSIHKVHRHL